MKAVVIDGYGGADALQLRDVPMPVVRDRDLLVEVHAAGVNPVDWKIREGYLKGRVDYRFPVILGMDGAGVVKETGPRATRFRAGDAVYFCADFVRLGTYAFYVAVNETLVAGKPDNLSFEEAASVPLVALTSWQALVEAAGMKAGHRVLVHAGSGGVGSFAIQLAKARGAYVAATCSGANTEFVRGLGADQVVDYTREDFSAVLRDFDIALDTLAGEVYRKSFQVLKKGGVVVSILEPPDEALAEQTGVRAEHVLMHPDGAQLEEIAGLLREGKIKPVVGTVLPLEKVAEAHTLSASHHARGKIVLRVRGGA